MLVLCVDDDPLVLNVTSAMLRELGHEVVEAGDGTAALQSLTRRGKAIDVMMTDIRMPGMTGFTLARKARKEISALTVIYMTGFNDGPTPPGPILYKPCTMGGLDRLMKSITH